MNKLNNIALTYEQVTGANLPVFLAGIRDEMEYGLDGKPTGTVKGQKAICYAPANHFEQVIVRVADWSSFPLSQEEIETINASSAGPVRVTFEDFLARLYDVVNIG